LGQELDEILPHRCRLELVGRHLISAFLAKLAIDGEIRAKCFDQILSSVAVRADRRDLKSMD